MTPVPTPETVDIVEVFPRDGLQRFPEFVPTDVKVDIIDRLSETGVAEIEVTSFTHPEAVPNLRDAAAVCAGIDRHPEVTYSALVPNTVGMERAIDAGVDKVGALIAVSETYNRKNQNMTVEESLDEIEALVSLAAGTDIDVEAGIAQSFFCPYEGEIAPEATLGVVEAVLEAGVDEVSLATSMGMADPRAVEAVLEPLVDRYPDLEIGMHLHDTNGMSLANVLVAMEYGVRQFDTALCGLGGGVVLPDELRSVGNTPTEDLANMLREMDIDTGVDFDRLVGTARAVSEELELDPSSHVLRGGTKSAVLESTAGRN